MSSLGLLFRGRGLYSRLGRVDAAEILQCTLEGESDADEALGTGGGHAGDDFYTLILEEPKVIEATSHMQLSTTDLRGAFLVKPLRHPASATGIVGTQPR